MELKSSSNTTMTASGDPPASGFWKAASPENESAVFNIQVLTYSKREGKSTSIRKQKEKKRKRLLAIVYRIIKKQHDRLFERSKKLARCDGKEICGLITNSYNLELIELNNKIKRGGGFAFYCGEVRKIVASWRLIEHEIVGTFHSHPMYIAEPSKTDIENAVDDSLMLIFDVIGKASRLWRVKNMRYLERKFILIDE